MVDLTLTDEQKDLRELAHNFAEKEIRSVAWEYDEHHTFPSDVIKKAHEIGLMNVVNFAHGEFYTLGAYAALFVLSALAPNFLVAILGDADSWPHWFGGMRRVAWTSEEPHGVGAPGQRGSPG